jgi:hypothetical protein
MRFLLKYEYRWYYSRFSHGLLSARMRLLYLTHKKPPGTDGRVSKLERAAGS